MSPQRIQRRRTKGWRMPEGAVYVGRGSGWGNPYRISELNGYASSEEQPDGAPMDRQDVVDAFAAEVAMADLFNEGAVSAILREVLGGKDLACWCPLEDENGSPVPCHADVLLEIANRGGKS